MVFYLSVNYGKIANIFFEWFLKQMEEEEMVVYQVLENVSSNHIV